MAENAQYHRLRQVSRASSPPAPLKVYNVEGQDAWHGLTLVDLESGLPAYFGEEHLEHKDQVGSFALPQMAAELGFKCGVLVRHLDVPFIEAKAQCTVAMQMLDVSSDVFFILDLLRSEVYATVNPWVKVAYYTFFIVSQVLWVGLAGVKAVRRWHKDCAKVTEKKDQVDANLTWDLKGKWLAGAFWENLFPSPVTLLSGRRIMKRAPLGGQAISLIGYATPAAFKFRYARGAQSLWPTLLLEDVPLLMLQGYILYQAEKAGAVFIINSVLSLVSMIHKGITLYEQNKHREIYRGELRNNIKAATESSDEKNRDFWKGVYEDEFGTRP